MTLTGYILILCALGLLALLVWAGRPHRTVRLSLEETLNFLSEPKHASHLPPILQALHLEDREFLKKRGKLDLANRLQEERRNIGLQYLDVLQNEFEVLLAASRTLAIMSPELIAMEEFQRLKLSLRFRFLCACMRIRLKLGVCPWTSFGVLSQMAGRLTIGLEKATSRMAEQTVKSAEYGPLFGDGSRSAGEL